MLLPEISNKHVTVWVPCGRIQTKNDLLALLKQGGLWVLSLPGHAPLYESRNHVFFFAFANTVDVDAVVYAGMFHFVTSSFCPFLNFLGRHVESF